MRDRPLVIVADGALQYIPFAMLPSPKVRQESPGVGGDSSTGATREAFDGYRPLIVEHEIVSLPSASTLAVQRRELAGRQVAPNKIAVIADPVFESTDARVRSKLVGTPEPDNVGDAARTRTLSGLAPARPSVDAAPR